MVGVQLLLGCWPRFKSPRAFLGRADGPAPAECFRCQSLTLIMPFGHQHSSPVAFAQAPILEHLEGLIGEIQKTDQVGHRRSTAPDPSANLLLADAKLVHQGSACLGLLDRVEVLPGHVLDECHLERD